MACATRLPQCHPPEWQEEVEEQTFVHLFAMGIFDIYLYEIGGNIRCVGCVYG